MSADTQIRQPAKGHPGWLAEIRFAQQRKTYTILIGGSRIVTVDRLCYTGIGVGEPAPDECKDCGTLKGMYHVPGCELEVCPKCLAQVMECNCSYVDTWHKMPEPDKKVHWYQGETQHVVDPVATYANGTIQLDRFHIAVHKGSYIILFRDPNTLKYRCTSTIIPAAHEALCEVPKLIHSATQGDSQ